MQIDVNFDDHARDLVADHVQTQLRWAFGGYSSEVKSVRVGFRPTRVGVECAVDLELRGRRKVRVQGLGKDFEDALRFAAERARAAVARRLDNDRILGR